MDRITICEGCRGGGEAMAAALRALVVAEVRCVDCMIVCADPVTVSFRGPGKAAYLFAGVAPGQVGELAEFARLYAAAKDGIIEDVRSCGDLRLRLIGRIPA